MPVRQAADNIDSSQPIMGLATVPFSGNFTSAHTGMVILRALTPAARAILIIYKKDPTTARRGLPKQYLEYSVDCHPYLAFEDAWQPTSYFVDEGCGDARGRFVRRQVIAFDASTRGSAPPT